MVQYPLTCAEHDADVFRLVRRHEAELDRWFTQRLGCRLHIDADTARLFKTGFSPDRRPIRTVTGRPFTTVEYTLLALVLAATAAGPSVISLRDLVGDVRSAAAEAEIVLPGDVTERRSLVTVLRWMIDRGLVAEVHQRVEAYGTDDTADAVLRIRPDRIVLLLVPAVAGADGIDEIMARADRRAAGRQWMRCRLVEDPVLYRSDLTDDEWGELRRRLGEEERLLDEMFGLVLEIRAEGMAAIDPDGSLADRRFPAGGTLGHATLLVIGELLTDGAARDSEWFNPVELHARVGELAGRYTRRWSNEYIDNPDRLARHVRELLVDLRLAEVRIPEDGSVALLRLLPAAARFAPNEMSATGDAANEQTALW